MNPTSTAKTRREAVLEFFETATYATVSQVYEEIPREHRSATPSSTYDSLDLLVKKNLLKVKKKKGCLNLYFLPDTPPPSDEQMPPRHKHQFVQGAYSRVRKFQNYYYDNRY